MKATTETQPELTHPTLPCPGEAHGTPADHCMLCAPGWGTVPAYKAVSCEAQWLLHALLRGKELELRGAPDVVIEAGESLIKLGYVAMPERVSRRRGCTTWFHTYVLTPLGKDAAEKLRR